MTDELREKIADQILRLAGVARGGAEMTADRILAIPEIAAGLKLLQMEVDLGEYDMSAAFSPKP
jgi:hypothetical protein